MFSSKKRKSDWSVLTIIIYKKNICVEIITFVDTDVDKPLLRCEIVINEGNRVLLKCEIQIV